MNFEPLTPQNYIFGSPTFWTPYFTEVNDYDEYKTEYGFFNRQDSYDRNLLITAGDQEDQDYKEYYGDNDSTLEGVEHLKDRLNNYGISTLLSKMGFISIILIKPIKSNL